MSERVIPPPELRSSSPLSQGDKGNGKRKGENGNLRVSESRSMVGTRHAVSDNKSISGLGMPSPYNPERKQIR